MVSNWSQNIYMKGGKKGVWPNYIPREKFQQTIGTNFFHLFFLKTQNNSNSHWRVGELRRIQVAATDEFNKLKYPVIFFLNHQQLQFWFGFFLNHRKWPKSSSPPSTEHHHYCNNNHHCNWFLLIFVFWFGCLILPPM